MNKVGGGKKKIFLKVIQENISEKTIDLLVPNSQSFEIKFQYL